MMYLRLGVFVLPLIPVLTGCGSGYGSSSHSGSSSAASSGYGSGSYSGSSGGTSGTPRASKGHVNTIEASGKYEFRPATIRVRAGTTVTWTNKSGAPHTVTSDRSGVFDKILPPGNTISITFSHPGTYPYHCIYHPYMHATVIVTR